jgi:hypothetical protein
VDDGLRKRLEDENTIKIRCNILASNLYMYSDDIREELSDILNWGVKAEHINDIKNITSKLVDALTTIKNFKKDVLDISEFKEVEVKTMKDII